MYGSSKVLLSLVKQLRAKSETYNPIVCIPPDEGPLKDILKKEGIHTIELPVVKLNRSMLKSLKFIGLFREYFKAKKIFKRETKGITIDCIQSNTLATLFGAFYCVFHKPRHIIHVHEIMDRPKIASFFLRMCFGFYAIRWSIILLRHRNFIMGLRVLFGRNRLPSSMGWIEMKRILQKHKKKKLESFILMPKPLIFNWIGRADQPFKRP